MLTTDYIIDETLTLLRAHDQKCKAIEFGQLIFVGRLGRVHYLTRSEIAAAWEVFRTFADKEWSFTDCTSKIVNESLGTVAVVP